MRASDMPVVPDELIKALEATFTDRLPLKDYDLRTIDRMVGQQDVLTKLRHWRDKRDPL